MYASFNSPSKAVISSENMLFVTEATTPAIRSLSLATGTAPQCFFIDSVYHDGVHVHRRRDACVACAVCFAGVVSTVCGSLTAAGYTDGACAVAKFSANIVDIAIDDRRLYVADAGNNAIRVVDLLLSECLDDCLCCL